MTSVYIVVQNGESYPKAYTTFEDAKSAIYSKNYDHIQKLLEENDGYVELKDLVAFMSEEEDTETNKTQLYIEKEIYITVHKLPIC